MNLTNGDTATNKAIFDQLFQKKDAIEQVFGNPLEWLRLDDKKSSRVQFGKTFDGYNEDNWGAMIEWLVKHFVKLERAFRPEIETVKRNR
jgi:hypothetical protein